MNKKLIDLSLFYGKEWFMEQFNEEYASEVPEASVSDSDIDNEQIEGGNEDGLQETSEESEEASEEKQEETLLEDSSEEDNKPIEKETKEEVNPEPTFDVKALEIANGLSYENATLKAQLEQQKQAVEFFNYVKNNPQILEAMRASDDPEVASTFNAIPTAQEEMIQNMQNQIAELQLRNEVAGLKAKYPDFKEEDVLKYAGERRILDLEVAYKAIKADELAKAKTEEKPVDMEALKKQIREELMKEMEEDKSATSTIVGKGISEEIEAKEYSLTPEQQYIAKQFGMTDEEYYNYLN